MAKTSRAPWKRPNPRKKAGKASKHLSSAKKSAAKARARRAGRPYPNLVDNMRMAAEKTKKKAAKKRGKKTSGAKAFDAKKAARKRSARETGKESRRRFDCHGPQGIRRARRLASQTRRDKEGVRDDAFGYAPEGKLGGSILRPQQIAAAGRCERPSDPSRAFGPRLGGAGSKNRRGGPSDRCKRRTIAGALSAHKAAAMRCDLVSVRAGTAYNFACTSWGRFQGQARNT